MKRGIKLFICVLFVFSSVWSVISAEIEVIGELTHVQNAQPGESYETRIVLKNSGDKETAIKVFQRDFSYSSDGRQFFHEKGAQKRSNAAWITYSPEQKTVLPLETAEVVCSIRVPDDQTLAGTYWSLIIIESSLDKRYAIQMITEIGLTGTVQIEFVKTSLVREMEKVFLDVDVKNTGERLLRPTLYVELYDEDGNFVGKVEGGAWRIYPESSVRYRVELTHLPVRVYKAMIIVDNLDEHVFGTEFLIERTSPG